MNKKIYGGIYSKGPSKKTDRFLMDPAITQVENEMVPYYLLQTIAHDLMLAKKGLIPKKSAKKILKSLLEYLDNESIAPSSTTGDVHETTEKQLTKDIGEEAGWMHLARSRNDQCVNDAKLLAKDKSFILLDKLLLLSKILLDKSEQYKTTVMPGFTHTRVAMPSTFGFWWQSYLLQIVEFIKIYIYTLTEIDKNPLGAGAAYGTNWPIDPDITTDYQGYTSTLKNALFAINSRGHHEGYLIGLLSNYFVTLSKMMEDLILWSSPEFDYIGISEDYTTGSSIMPQKMNPDIAEKIRSKCSKILANFNYVFVAIKGTPSGYNRDSADTKIAISQSLNEAVNTTDILIDMLEKVAPIEDKMLSAVIPTLATKLADQLTEKYQIPFRQSHHIVGKALALVGQDISKVDNIIVAKAVEFVTSNKVSISNKFVSNALNPQKSLDQYSYIGSPNPKHVETVNKNIDKEITKLSKKLKSFQNKFLNAKICLIEDAITFIKES